MICRMEDVMIKFLTKRLKHELTVINIYIYTGCNRRKGPNFGRVFLM